MENSHSREQQALVMWSVYDHPKDYPNHFVARRWDIYSGLVQATEQVLFHTDLDSLRGEIVQRGCYHRLERNEGDDPVILETWL